MDHFSTRNHIYWNQNTERGKMGDRKHATLKIMKKEELLAQL